MSLYWPVCRRCETHAAARGHWLCSDCMEEGEDVYTICFDFPEHDEPVFAGWHKGGLGYAPTLATAARFATEEEAERTLENGYGPAMRECGAVVEIGGPS